MNEEHARTPGAGEHIRPIDWVREGMNVVDAAGQEIGRVELVRMGDPQAATPRGNMPAPSGLIEALREVFAGDESSIPEAKREQLLRMGFIKIDGPGLADTDRYVRSDQISHVAGDTVTLTVTKDQLPAERW
jgi:hypothetical protein